MERKIYELTIDQWVELREFIRSNFNNYYNSAEIAIAMDEFAQRFDIVAMWDFYVWAKNEGLEDMWIASNLMHDLNGRMDRCFAPRTESYRGINERSEVNREMCECCYQGSLEEEDEND